MESVRDPGTIFCAFGDVTWATQELALGHFSQQLAPCASQVSTAERKAGGQRPPAFRDPAACLGYSISTASRATTSPAGLFSVAWAPARSARLTRMAASVTISAMSMIPADTSNPRENPTDSA